MRISFALRARMLAVALFAITLPCADAQAPKPAPTVQDALYQTVAALDTKLFDAVNSKRKSKHTVDGWVGVMRRADCVLRPRLWV